MHIASYYNTGYYPTRLIEAASNTGPATGTWNNVGSGASQLTATSNNWANLNGTSTGTFIAFLGQLNSLKDNAGVKLFIPAFVSGVDTWEDVKTRVAQFHTNETSHPDAVANQGWVLGMVTNCTT